MLSSRDHHGLDGDLKAEGDRRRTRFGPQRSGRWRRETFLAREEWAKPRGRKSIRRHCGSGDRGVAGLWPDRAIEGPGARLPRPALLEICRPPTGPTQGVPNRRVRNGKPGVQKGCRSSLKRRTTRRPRLVRAASCRGCVHIYRSARTKPHLSFDQAQHQPSHASKPRGWSKTIVCPRYPLPGTAPTITKVDRRKRCGGDCRIAKHSQAVLPTTTAPTKENACRHHSEAIPTCARLKVIL